MALGKPRAVQLGIAAKCPFCQAWGNPAPPAGTEIFFLNGSDVGQTGLVVKDKWGWAQYGEFLVERPYDRPGTQCRVSPEREAFLERSLFSVPEWMLPCSIEDVFAVHQDMLVALNGLKPSMSHAQMGEQVYGLVASIWWRRLPVSGSELLPMLEAHGLPDRLRSKFVELFEFGRLLLVKTQGRIPIKRKRMGPLSKGRYLTPHQRELHLRLFGHD